MQLQSNAVGLRPSSYDLLNHQNEQVDPNVTQTCSSQYVPDNDFSAFVKPGRFQKNPSMSETAVWRTTQPLCCMSNPMMQLEARGLVAGLALRLAAK